MDKRLVKALDKLFHDLAIAELQQFHKENNKCELSYHDTLYLNIIEAHPGKYTSSRIADVLKVSRPAVTQKINELVKKGYVIRTQSEIDKRVYYLKTNPNMDYYNKKDRSDEFRAIKILIDKYGEAEAFKLCEMIEFLSDMLFYEKTKGEK